MDLFHFYKVYINPSNCWVSGQLPIPSTAGLPWWVSPRQGKDRSNLQSYIQAYINVSSLLQSEITSRDLYYWPANLISPGHGFTFSYCDTTKKAQQKGKLLLKNKPVSVLMRGSFNCGMGLHDSPLIMEN